MKTPPSPPHTRIHTHTYARRRAKYELQHVVRTNLAANDAAYNCVYEGEDEDNVRGVRLSKELMAIAGAACVCVCACVRALAAPV